MRRRDKAGGKAAKTQRPKTLKRRNAPKTARLRNSVAAAKETNVARLTRDLQEALEQQTAMSEILGVISSSPTDLAPVFNAILANATRLCEGNLAALWRYDGKFLIGAAQYNASAAFVDKYMGAKMEPGRAGPARLAALERRTVHVADITTEPGFHPLVLQYERARSVLAVPLLRGKDLVGVIAIWRREVRPFTDKQIELVKNFAAQAVIAIENTRLLNELRQRTDDLSEALEQQTATSEVLKVISSSPGELKPVFDALLANAVRICDAKFGVLFLSEGDAFRYVALHGAPPAFAEARRREPVTRVKSGTTIGRVAATKKPAQTADIRAEPAYTSDPERIPILELAGARTILGVPMLKESQLVGAIVIYRQEVRPFTDKQIDLLSNFAAQAVIAIENTRLLSELRESLQQQTATSEVLKVISSSPGELNAVFEAMLENAVRICGATFGNLWLREGDGFRVGATHGAPQAYVDYLRSQDIFHPDPRVGLGQVLRTKEAFQVADVAAAATHGDTTRQALIELAGARTLIGVPMLKDNEVVGAIGIYRQEVRPFTDKQIELVQNFAAQAVIAIENTRLLNELRESLQQQTATADVLKVISSSPGELQPVFHAILENATHICGAKFGVLWLCKDGGFLVAATHSIPAAYREQLQAGVVFHPGPSLPIARAASTRQAVHIADLRTDPGYLDGEPVAKGGVELGQVRTLLAMPMLKDREVVGAFAIYRQEVLPFTDKQIELVQNFAAQAVIAIENTRLLSELRESLQQQTATADVLKVISSSPGELEPVFQAMLENAVRICGAKFGTLFRSDGDVVHLAAQFGTPPALAEFQQKRGPFHPEATGTGILGRVIRTKAVAQSADSAADPNPGVATKLGGARSIVGVPMFKDDALVGAIVIYRQEVRPFTDKQMEVLKNFAAQAVIAIENTRLLSELRQRTDDLSESLEQQTATSEVLKVISSSPGDLEPVFTAMLENATRVCQAKHGFLFRTEGDGFRVAAELGDRAAFIEQMKHRALKPGPLTPIGRLGLTRQIVHVPDLSKDRGYLERDPLIVTAVEQGGVRSVLVVPMIKDGELIGAIGMHRRDVRPFTDKQIDLLTNFASQAVIAIENTRLLSELRESLQQQTATADVLKVISSSPGELEPVFQAMLENAVRLCVAKFGSLVLFEGNAYRRVALHNAPAVFVEAQAREPVRPLAASPTLSRLAETRQTVSYADILAEQPEEAIGRLGGARTVLAVPMLKDDRAVGAISIYRQEVRPFTDKQMEVLKNFAAQAVIAIENTRLLNELRESLQQQTATADVLKVISSSPGELEPVFQAMLENATRICGAKFGTLYLYDGDAFHATAFHNAPPAFIQDRKRAPLRPGPNTSLGRAARTKQVAQIVDITKGESYLQRDPLAVAGVDLGGYRTVVSVPMLKEDNLIGVISIYRQEVLPFTDKQIELVSNFAAQAVIAIENTRLLNELRQSLEQQTATSEVLQVISSSPGELTPVFESMLENAVRICEASFGNLLLYENDAFRHVALHNAPQAWAAEQQRDPVAPRRSAHFLYRVADTKQVIHIADIALENPDEPIAKVAGARTLLIVPMLKEKDLIGVIAIYRQEVCPFTDKQIELVQNFAAQAVIAVENARLLNELRESLQQQTATADVLKVISSSPGELEPVFDAMLANAVRICEANFGMLFRFEDGAWRAAAMHGVPPAFAEFWQRGPQRPGRLTALGRTVETKQTVHIVDVRTDPAYVEGEPVFVAAVKLGGFRTILNVPMLKDNELIGVFAIYRQEVRAFTDKQIELVKNFAAQAVIAIENTRLLSELRTRTNELAQSVGELQALGEVSQAVNSTLDLETVLTTIVGRAVQLSRTDAGAIYVFDEERKEFRLHATYGMSEAMIAAITDQHIGLGEKNIGAATVQRKPIQVPDTRDEPASPVNEIILREGYRSILIIPLLRPDHIVGALVVRRKTPGEFPQSTIELLQTFADQSVVAIQNARLFESVEKSLEDLRTTQDRLVQTQKLASLGQLTAGIAHEIKNPLNFVNNFSAVSVELIDELRGALAGANLDKKLRAEISEISDTLQGNLDKVVQHGKRADAIVKNMLLHSREGSGEHRLVDINALVEEGLNLAYHGARAEKQGFNISLERSLDPSTGEVDVFPQDITRVLLNLISNGFYAATKRKAQADSDGYEPTLAVATKNLGDSVEIRIRDNGSGIPPEVKEKMFNPFFTTKPAGEGTGLGLSISHDIVVKQHGGSIEVDTQPGAFTEFRIILPRSAASLAKSGERA